MIAAAIVIGLIAAAFAVAQVALTRVAEERVRARLTESRGSAEVSIRALPATRLLRNRGDRIEVRGRGLEIGLAAEDPAEVRTAATASSPAAGLTALDGFADVDIELVDFRTGPFVVAAFVLARSGGGSYALATRATTTPAGLAALGLDRWRAIPGAALLGMIAGPAIGSREIPISVEIELVSRQGSLRVASGGGTIAGYPAGPLATTIAAAVARRLEIAP